MRLPQSDASDEEWASYLETIRKNPGLDPDKGGTVPLLR